MEKPFKITLKEYKLYMDGSFVGKTGNTIKNKSYIGRIRNLKGFTLKPVFV